MIQKEEWNGFEGRLWKEEVNVRDFIQNNYTPYDGDNKFLAGPTAATKKLFDELQRLQKEEHNKVSVGKDGVKRTGVLDMDTDVVTGLTAHPAAYICPEGKELEKVVGGGFKDFLRAVGCFTGLCDDSGFIQVEHKVSADGKCEYFKQRCPRCGRYRYLKLEHMSPETGYVDAISEQIYNAVPGGSVYVI